MEIKVFFEKNKIFVGAFLAMGFAALLGTILNSEPEPQAAPQTMESVDTMIPKGHILIPLELENLEQISSLIGSSGVVDLYTGGTETKRRKLIASRIKIIQAPFNPQVYAALIHEDEGVAIQNYFGPFRATVQNPKQAGGRVTQVQTKKLSITYQK
jgi:hypothetical protein